MTLFRSLSIALLLATATLSTPSDARMLRLSGGNKKNAAAPFEWVEDPHAADPCTAEPNCVNHVKYGFDVVPRNVSEDATIVFQEAKRPKGLAAVLDLEIVTQPGCVVSACTTKNILVFVPREDCFNAFAEKKANADDGVSAVLHFGGNYYENLPAGELYAKFEKKNYLTEEDTCTFEVRSGYKRWY
ncbi:hypothetical protein Poli38472_014361 [Pythium oligandrum]|uniref:Uncharacterized protein n=1 Tax=Pythium oligandrum TaxID=41045 RepID=A0A8K1C7N4_PYTOL|nr:hypothetical protein Poli38472_014361 [Pythium oligandrum]|eukprot:TMW57758.1 hypothetical protein Poli38472_014361 [Pythium oligandrum]